MDAVISERLAGVRVREPALAGTLQVFGLEWQVPDSLVYTTLDEALAAKTVEITEVSAGGRVGEIKVINRGDSAVLIVAGELLEGAKQNRVSNASIMVPARSEQPLPVTCVESGRWDCRSPEFRSHGSFTGTKLRGIMSRHVAASYRSSGRPTADQRAVWDEVGMVLHGLDALSPTASLLHAYDQHAATLRKAVADIRLPAECQGVAFVLNGQVAGVDLFDKAATLSKLLPKLARGYALDALQASPETRPIGQEEVAAWLKSAAGTASQRFDSPGLGQDVRIEGEQVVGACLIVEELPVHTELFTAPTRR